MMIVAFRWQTKELFRGLHLPREERLEVHRGHLILYAASSLICAICNVNKVLRGD